MNAPNPWEAIGLPATWAPVPLVYRLATVDGIADGVAVHQHVLIVDGPTGRHGYAFSDDAARQLVDKLTEQLSGIEIARTVQLHQANGGTA